MTTPEMFECFAIERTAEGYPSFQDVWQTPPSERKLYERHCRLNCITNPDVIESLWQEYIRLREDRRGR